MALAVVLTSCPQKTSGSVQGVVFRDSNLNALQDSNEVGIPGLTIALSSANGLMEQTQTTASGRFEFSSVEVGQFVVTVQLPNQIVVTTLNNPQTITVNPDLWADAPKIGIKPANGTVTGIVFDDANLNGKQDANESNLEAVQVIVEPVAGSPKLATTNALGVFSLEASPGQASVRALVNNGRYPSSSILRRDRCC
jgi:hypothetical protein